MLPLLANISYSSYSAMAESVLIEFDKKGRKMNSKTRTLIIAIFAAVVLWLLGGFVFGKSVGMICVIIGITLIGLAAGNIMNTPEPSQKKAP